MRANRHRRRRVGDTVIAIDLGTSRTQVFVPGLGIVLDEPTLVAYDTTGEMIAAGHDAWIASAMGPARLRMPVRGGVVRDPVRCVKALMLLLRKPRLTALAGRDVAVCVPVGARAADASVLAGVVASATGGRVLLVESALAAAIGVGFDISQSAPRLVCDIGAGVTEMAVVGDGQVMAGSGLRTDVRSYDDDPEGALRRVVELFHRVLDDLPERAAADAVAQPLLVVGGGAMRSDLVARLAEACHMPVQVPNEPRAVVVRGLGNCVAAPLVAA